MPLIDQAMPGAGHGSQKFKPSSVLEVSAFCQALLFMLINFSIKVTKKEGKKNSQHKKSSVLWIFLLWRD